MNEEELARVMSRPDLVADGEEDMPGSGLRSVYSTDSFYSALGDEDEETREMLQRLHELENNSDSDVELELEALETELHRYEKRLGRRVRRSARMRASKIDADAVAKQFLRGTFVDGVEEQSVDEELKEEELWMDAMSSSDSESVGSPHSPSVSSSTSSEIRGRPGAIRRGKQTRLAGEEALPGMVSPLTPEDELTEEACFSGGEDGGFVDADEDEDEDLLNENAAGAAPPQKKGRWNWLWGKFPSRQKSLDAPSSISAEASPVEDPSVAPPKKTRRSIFRFLWPFSRGEKSRASSSEEQDPARPASAPLEDHPLSSSPHNLVNYLSSSRGSAPPEISTSPKSQSSMGSHESIGSSVGSDNSPKLRPRKVVFVKSLRPTSEQLRSLHLKEGCNSVSYTIESRLQGKQTISANIFLWKSSSRVVISDVDGTITKSDALGIFLPMFGKDWSHRGIANLFSHIDRNGYRILFLSSRSIVQAHQTRKYLSHLKQGEELLPAGPVLVSPSLLFRSLAREVVFRNPEEFKIAALRDFKNLFEPEVNPFFAGFGNKKTDQFAYLTVGVPEERIFIINSRSRISSLHREYESYEDVDTFVHQMFPPYREKSSSSITTSEFNAWNFWKPEVPELDESLMEFLGDKERERVLSPKGKQ